MDDEIEDEHEHEPEVPVEKEPVIKKPAEVVAPKESERQLSKKELKKKELAELEEMLAQFGYNKPDGDDIARGDLFVPLLFGTQLKPKAFLFCLLYRIMLFKRQIAWTCSYGRQNVSLTSHYF